MHKVMRHQARAGGEQNMVGSVSVCVGGEGGDRRRTGPAQARVCQRLQGLRKHVHKAGGQDHARREGAAQGEGQAVNAKPAHFAAEKGNKYTCSGHPVLPFKGNRLASIS